MSFRPRTILRLRSRTSAMSIAKPSCVMPNSLLRRKYDATFALWMMFLLGKQAMFGHDPPMYLRSMTATCLPSPAKVHAEPAERRLPSQNGAGTTFKGPRGYIAFCFCMTGSDGVDAYLSRRQLERQSPGQRFDGAFRGSVQQGSRHRMRADDRAEVDDAPAVGPESLDRLLHGENRPENVDVVVEVKALFGDLRERAEAEYPGVVDQNVQSSERRIHFFE